MLKSDVKLQPTNMMDYINVHPKADEYSQLSLPHGTKQKRIMKKLKTQEGQHPLTGQRAPPISGGT